MSEKITYTIHDLNEEDFIPYSQPFSLPSSEDSTPEETPQPKRPSKYKGQKGNFRSIEEIDLKYRHVFSYPYFNLVQSAVIDDALYSNKSMVVCAPTGSGKTVIFEMAIVQLLMELEDKNCTDDFKIIYMAPVKALCTERITEWYSKFMKLGLLCIEVTGDTDVDFSQLQPYRIIITTPEKWDLITRRCNNLELVKLFLIDEVHSLNDEARGPVLEAVVSRVKTVQCSVQWCVRLVAVSATISNPDDVANWLGGSAAVHYKFGDECRPVKLNRVVEGYPCSNGTSIFKFDIILNYKLWPIIQKYYNGKPTLIFCNTRKSVMLTAETLSKEITVGFHPEQRAKLTAIASSIKNKKLQSLVLSGVGCHHAGLLLDERNAIERAFRNRDLPILITTTTLAMGVNLPAHLVIIKNTQQYVNGAYQEYSISTVLQMVGRAGRPQFDTQATAVIMTRLQDKARYQSLVGGCEPLQSFLHKRLAENINSEVALGTIRDVAQCVHWLNSTFLRVRAVKDPKRYLGLSPSAPEKLIAEKIEDLCVRAMNGLQSSGLITMDELTYIESTEAGRLMSVHYLDLETMKLIMKIEGDETLERLLWMVCESHELSDMHLRIDERRCLNSLNRSNSTTTIRYQMKGKISTRQMKLNCIIQAVLGCLPIPDPSLNQEALKVMRIADRVCKCLVSYLTRPNFISQNPKFFSAILNSLILAKCITAHLWENSLYVSRQLKGIGPTFSTLLVTAGKTNFMLLEESHPRDLERIMNKGPPVGNVLRKQISLLPKYNITISPINDQKVSVQLTLLNQAYLVENMDNLTAGARHKSYIIVGDNENFLLYFLSFKDSDLINIYEGCLNFEINRKPTHGQKVIAHCISSSFVGIDTHCEYSFQDISSLKNKDVSHQEVAKKISPKRQTYIPDIFKQRKRKINEKDSMQPKEKKNKETIENLTSQREDFEDNSKIVKENSNKTLENESKFLENSKPVQNRSDILLNEQKRDDDLEYQIVESDFFEDFDYEDVDDVHINDLLKEIENEVQHPSTSAMNKKYIQDSKQYSYNSLINNSKSNNFTPVKSKNKMKNNFAFIDKLEKESLGNSDASLRIHKPAGFSDEIKSYIQKYLVEAKIVPKNTGTDLIGLDEKLDINSPNVSNISKGTNVSEDNVRRIIDLTDTKVQGQNSETKTYKSEDTSNIFGFESINNSSIIKNPEIDLKAEVAEIFLENDKINSSPIDSDRYNTGLIEEAMFNNEDIHQSNTLQLFKPQYKSPKQEVKTDKKYIDETSSNENNHGSKSTIVPCEKKFLNPISMYPKTQILERSLNISETPLTESSDTLNSTFISPDDQKINDRLFKDVKKYSFKASKTVGVHNKNITRICTLNVALDVTEIIHTEDTQFASRCKNSSDNKIETNEANIILKNYKKDSRVTDLNAVNTRSFIKNKIPLKFNEKPQILATPETKIIENSDKNIQEKDKKTTVRDILMKYNKNMKSESCLKHDETAAQFSSKHTDRLNLKSKRKYRISDLDKVDVTLPESLIPIQSRGNSKSINLKSSFILQKNETKPSQNLSIIEEISHKDAIDNIDVYEEEENSHDDLKEINSNIDFEVSVNDSFEFDQSLLDPKTLLQSNLNNEVIIPPPPEFCEDYSPKSSPTVNQGNIESEYDSQSSVLSDHNDNNKTVDDSRDEIYSSPSLTSGNILFKQNNSFENFSRSSKNIRHDLTQSRLYKLSQFKFNRKNMLKK